MEVPTYRPECGNEFEPKVQLRDVPPVLGSEIILAQVVELPEPELSK